MSVPSPVICDLDEANIMGDIILKYNKYYIIHGKLIDLHFIAFGD
jgi:hypothetical protein